MTATDAQRLSILVKNGDLDEIEKLIAAGTKQSVEEIDSIVSSAAENNDNLASEMYKARNMPPSNFQTDLALNSVIQSAKKSMVDGVVNLSGTTIMFSL